MKNIYEYIKLSKKERQTHLNLSIPCEERGTTSTQCRGLLAYYLDTSVPQGNKIHCCHACNNGECSNPLHLYWGTCKENVADMINAGTFNKPNVTGISNINYKLPPWLNFNSTEKTKSDWKLANKIYNETINHDFSKYGKGQSFLVKKYKINWGPAKNIIKMFRNGWVPIKDKKWFDFAFNIMEYQITI